MSRPAVGRRDRKGFLVTEILSAVVLFGVLLAASAGGVIVRPYLSERHLNREVIELLQIFVSMLVTFAAIVLGLLTTSAKTAFDAVSTDVNNFSSSLVEFDRTMAEYGPETAAIRTALAGYAEAVIAQTWRSSDLPTALRGGPPTSTGEGLDKPNVGDALENIKLSVLELQPHTPLQHELRDIAIQQGRHVIQLRWQLWSESQTSISIEFYSVMVFWLMIVFFSIGLSMPRNALAFTGMLLCALSIASAMFAILDMDTPFGGFLSVSYGPLVDAVATITR